uniref:AzlD domain-containing protein n=1 Tax=Eubacterium cellulosolvens TaxID=29322 RepID=UPI000489E880|nr:AzlD domain-containing protein [[Eubacterium] cellulosolvens]
MTGNVYVSMLIIALTIYAIRLMPFLFIRKPIKNRYFRSFLYYVPYVTLAVMTFPAILTATDHVLAGVAALVAGLIVAWVWGDLFAVAVTCCVAVFLCGIIL